MRAIIPVGGIGSRLRPHTYYLPKVLLNVAGKPILEHILDFVVSVGITDVSLVTGPLGDEIEKFVKSKYSINANFISQTEPLGLGHAIWCGCKEIDNEPILIILGDTLFEADLTPALTKQTNSIGIHPVDDPSRFGIVVLDEDRNIVKFIEKPTEKISNLAIVGIYVINDTILLKQSLNYLIENRITTKGEYQLTDALQRMIELGAKFETFEIDYWYDCGKPETLLETNRTLLSKFNHYKELTDCVIIPPVYIDDNALVTRSIIGPNTTIAKGAIVKDSIIKDSIISNDARVESYILENSIIGNNALVLGKFNSFNVGNHSEIKFI